jgi:hypothetical protein
VKNGEVYSNDAQINEHNRNNYWEQGFMEPDVILGDAIKILYPAANDNKLVYFRKAFPLQ